MKDIAWSSVVLAGLVLCAGVVVFAFGGKDAATLLFGLAGGIVIPAPKAWPAGKPISDNPEKPSL